MIAPRTRQRTSRAPTRCRRRRRWSFANNGFPDLHEREGGGLRVQFFGRRTPAFFRMRLKMAAGFLEVWKNQSVPLLELILICSHSKQIKNSTVSPSFFPRIPWRGLKQSGSGGGKNTTPFDPVLAT